jgi:hypothetical protein
MEITFNRRWDGDWTCFQEGCTRKHEAREGKKVISGKGKEQEQKSATTLDLTRMCKQHNDILLLRLSWPSNHSKHAVVLMVDVDLVSIHATAGVLSNAHQI